MFLGKQYAMPSVWPSSQTPVAENKKPKSGSWTSVWAEAVREVQRSDRDSEQLIATWSRG